MLFRKKIETSCHYCIRGTIMEDGFVLCGKRGVLSEQENCRKFKYDPCKRIPVKAKPLDFSQYNDHDFSL